MTEPEPFDAFYAATRTGHLHQAFALTGDLPAATSAVRDAYVAAWHHWRKVGRLDDPSAWVRGRAWPQALRRHRTRIWHRDRSLDSETQDTLAALADLPVQQRKVLLLNHLSSTALPDLGREIGVPVAEATRLLQTATAAFAVHRGVSSVDVRPVLDHLQLSVEATVWPRVTIIRRAGTARRRSHTVAGALVVVGGLVLGGAVVTDAQGLRATLQGIEAAPTPRATQTPASGVEPTTTPAVESITITDDELLDLPAVLAATTITGWRQTPVGAEGGADQALFPCQTTRFADTQGLASGARQFKARAGKGKPELTVTQTAEYSATEAAAKGAYRAMSDWFGSCAESRMQLLSTHHLGKVGTEARLIVLRNWQTPVKTLIAGIARTGRVSTVTLLQSPGAAEPDLKSAGELLRAAVNGVCAMPDTGRCAGPPRRTLVAPLQVGLPVGVEPGMLTELDLPPVLGVDLPWVGTDPEQAKTNLAATVCDETTFALPRMRKDLSRTFLIPDSELSDIFGLTQSIGWLPGDRADAFVDDVRRKLSTCSEREAGTEVTRLLDDGGRDAALTVWRVTTEISDKAKVTYLMAILRDGQTVSQLGFIPDGKTAMAPGAFVELAQRALDRLSELKTAKKSAG